MPDTMRAMVLTGHGGPEMLEMREVTRPEPAPGEVRVRVAASAVNNTDVNTRIGWYDQGDGAGGWSGPLSFPRIQGADVCGRIEAVGAGVDAARIGERVLIEPCLREARGRVLEAPWYLGSECDGGFAEAVCVASRHAYRIESDLSDAQLATFPCSWSTAENLLLRAGAKEGDRALVTGASGGVGSAAIQLLRARGVAPVAVSQPAKADALRGIGAAEVIGRDDDPAAHGPFDLVVDLVGGPAFPSLIACLAPRGRYAVSGAVAGAEVALDLRSLYLRDLTFHGCTVLDEGSFASLVGHIEAGRVMPMLAESFPLAEMAAAQEAFGRRWHVGKIGIDL